MFLYCLFWFMIIPHLVLLFDLLSSDVWGEFFYFCWVNIIGQISIILLISILIHTFFIFLTPQRCLNIDIFIIDFICVFFIDIWLLSKHIRIFLHAKFLVERITVVLALIITCPWRISVSVGMGEFASLLLIYTIPPFIQTMTFILLKLLLIIREIWIVYSFLLILRYLHTIFIFFFWWIVKTRILFLAA